MSITGHQMLIVPVWSTVRLFIGMQNLNLILNVLPSHCDRSLINRWQLAPLRYPSMPRRVPWEYAVKLHP
jgi:hypothetical protein